MSVAENPIQERTARNPQQELALGSFVGALALLGGLILVFATLPWFWHVGWANVWAGNEAMVKNVYLADALLILIEVGVIGALVYAAYRALQAYTMPGLRAGIFIAAVYVAFCLFIVAWLGGRLDQSFEDNAPLGFAVLAAVLAILVGLMGYVYLAVPAWRGLLESFEGQGWFHGTAYKGNQGVRVRRGTIVGILAVGVFGIATMVNNHFFGVERPETPNDWYWAVPFSQAGQPVEYAPIMFKVHMIMPILLGVLLIWLAWRIVNVPVFADFLIATEAEMNKVSWTTRKRLMQDTVVVLTTVFLFTGFLFVVDIIWIKVLSAPYIQVLLIDPREQAQKQQEVAKW